MYTIKRTEAFTDWFDGIKDGQTRGRLAARLRKATQSADIAKAIKLAATLED